MSIPVWGGVTFTATGRKIKQIIDHYPGAKGHLYVTSSYRSHTPNSHHGGRLSYGGSPTAAVDIGFGYPSGNRTGGQGLATWLMSFRSDLVELIHNPRWYVKNGRVVGPYAVAIHYDHVHVAMSSAQADRILRRLNGGKIPPATGGGNIRESVRKIKSQQKEINLAGYTPKLVEDGKWGPKTEAAVKWYQRKIGVGADGVWGKATDAAHKKYKSGKTSKPTPAPKPSGSNLGPAGSVRSVGSQQKEVNLAGYKPALVRDSKWGPKTEAGVKWYQRRIGVTADGVWGRQTDAAHAKYKAANKKASSPSTPVAGNRGKASPQLVVDGKMGPNTVKALQKNLGVPADGKMGPVTLKALQKRVGAKQDGILGPETVRKLQEYLNKG